MNLAKIRIGPAILVVAIFIMMATLGFNAPFSQPQGIETGTGITAGIGDMLFNEFLAVFEIVGILLVAALIGGLYMAKRDIGRDIMQAVERKPQTESEEARESMETEMKTEVDTDGSS